MNKIKNLLPILILALFIVLLIRTGSDNSAFAADTIEDLSLTSWNAGFAARLAEGNTESQAVENNAEDSYFLCIGEMSLLVDRFTKIVYLVSLNGTEGGITEYLAPNGQPYTFEQESNTLVPLSAYPDEVIQEDWILDLNVLVR